MSLVHAISIVLVGKAAQQFQPPVGMKHSQRRMRDTVEHIGLDGGVMDHVLEDDFVAHLQLAGETPVTHEVACQAAVAAKAVNELGIVFINMFGTADIGIVGHFQTVRHVTSKADIENSCADALVLDHIDDASN